MFDLILVVVVAYLLISHRKLAKRLSLLEGLERIIDRSPDVATSEQALPEPDSILPPQVLPGMPEPVRSEDVQAPKPRLASGPNLPALVLTWLRANWFYVLSALSLALAGLFAAQYAAEKGFLTPTMRVVFAAMFGGTLIAAGEIVRRRFGDHVESATAYIPSVFSGAGIVTLFGAVLTARSLYGLIGPEMALAGLVAVATLAIVLGWFYGPLLTAIGIIGATAAPLVVGGDPGYPGLLHGYYGLVALAGLAVNALQKWRGITEISIALPFGAATLVMMGAGGPLAYLVLTVALACAAVVFLGGRPVPDMRGMSPLVGRFLKDDGPLSWPNIMMTTIWLAAVIASVHAGLLHDQGVPIAGVALLALFVIPAFWSQKTDVVLDMPLFAAGGMLVLAWLSRTAQIRPDIVPAEGQDLSLMARIATENGHHALFFAGLAIAMSLICVWRSAAETVWRQRGWALGAMIAPVMLVLIELMGSPAPDLGMTWAILVMGVAGVATLMAERAARVDGEDRFRVALAALVGMSMTTLALVVLFSSAALTLALAVLVLAAAALDDRFNLPTMSSFVQAGVATLVYRVLFYPEMGLVIEGPLLQFLFVYLPPITMLIAASVLLTHADRPVMRAAIEGGVLVMSGIAATAALMRIPDQMESVLNESHWIAGLMATVWLVVAAASLRNAAVMRSSHTGPRKSLRYLLPLTFRYLSATAAILVASVILAFGFFMIFSSFTVTGVILINTLIPAYLVPGLVLGAASLLVPGLARWIRGIGLTFAGLLGMIFAVATIAHAWRGSPLWNGAVSDGELWTYTAMLLMIGAGLMIGSLVRGSRPMRLVANGFLVLAIAKVYLVDAPDLDGLVRAGSFLILGLCLAGLAWINRLSLRAQGNGHKV